MGYHPVRLISGQGAGPDQFAESLNGIGIDRAGLIYAVGDRQVRVFDVQGRMQRRWPTERPGYCVAIDDDGAVHGFPPSLVALSR